MKRLKNIKFRKISIDEIDDSTLLLNLYATQLLTLIIGLVIIFFQKKNSVFQLFMLTDAHKAILWGTVFAMLVVVMEAVLTPWVPEHVTDDGGINNKIFQSRPLWHIAVLSFVVAVCEEILFRGAVQYAFGAYWTSILFAAIHIRYLQHWIMTGLVFCISYGLGWIYMQTGSLLTPIMAHFLIDFVMGSVIRFGRERR